MVGLFGFFWFLKVDKITFLSLISYTFLLPTNATQYAFQKIIEQKLSKIIENSDLFSFVALQGLTFDETQ